MMNIPNIIPFRPSAPHSLRPSASHSLKRGGKQGGAKAADKTVNPDNCADASVIPTFNTEKSTKNKKEQRTTLRILRNPSEHIVSLPSRNSQTKKTDNLLYADKYDGIFIVLTLWGEGGGGRLKQVVRKVTIRGGSEWLGLHINVLHVNVLHVNEMSYV